MSEPVPILRLSNGDEFHCEYREVEVGDVDEGLAYLYADALNIGWAVGRPHEVVSIQGQKYWIWIADRA